MVYADFWSLVFLSQEERLEEDFNHWGDERRITRLIGCAVCHGPQAEGTRNGPALRGRGRSFTMITIAAALWKDGPKMYRRTRELKVQWPDLTEGDAGNLVSFLNTPMND